MGITTALTLQWVVSSSSCTSFWLLLPSSPSPPARLRPTLATDTTVSPPSTDLTTPLDTLDLSLAPVTSPSIVSTRERLRPNLATGSSVSPLSTTPTPTGPACPPPSLSPPAMAATERGVLMPSPATLLPTDTDTPPTDTDTPELLDTQEPPPPSWPGLPRV